MDGETSSAPAVDTADSKATNADVAAKSGDVLPAVMAAVTPVVNPQTTETSIILRPTVSTVASSSTTAPQTISVVNASGADGGAQQYYVVVGADGVNSLVTGLPAGITTATPAQMQGTIIGTVVGSGTRALASGNNVATTNVIAPSAPIAIKRGALRPATAAIRAPVVAKASVTLPKGQTLVPRVGQVQPPATSTSGIVKMITVPALGSQSTVSVYVPAAATTATATPLVRRASPTKALPIKTVTQPVQPGRALLHNRPAVAAPATTAPAVPASTTVAAAPIPVTAKKAPTPRAVPAVAAVTKPVVKPPAQTVVPTRVLTSKNTTSADRAAQYRRAIGESMIKLHKLETAIVKLNPDRATPFTVGEIFTQTAASFAKVASLTSHLSLDSMAPAEKRRWSPELITKFVAAASTFATSMKEIGDELKGRHEKQLITGLKRKAESEGAMAKKPVAASVPRVTTISVPVSKIQLSQNGNVEPPLRTSESVEMVSPGAAVPETVFSEKKSLEAKVEPVINPAPNPPPISVPLSVPNEPVAADAAHSTPSSASTTASHPEIERTQETLLKDEKDQKQAPLSDMDAITTAEVIAGNEPPAAENAVISEGIVEEGDLFYGTVSKVITVGLSFLQKFMEETTLVESQRYGPEIINNCSPVVAEQMLESFLNQML